MNKTLRNNSLKWYTRLVANIIYYVELEDYTIYIQKPKETDHDSDNDSDIDGECVAIKLIEGTISL